MSESAGSSRLKTSQYAYLAVKSETVTAVEIATAVGLEPDSVLVRGARRPAPPLPVAHVWAIECRSEGMDLDRQIATVIERIKPHAAELQALSQRADISVVLQLVRYFDDDDGQVGILGWQLGKETLEFLVSVSASIDSDEYGC